MRPGSIEAVFFAILFRPFPKPLATDFKEIVISLIMAPITTLAAMKMAETVVPYFLKISLTLSRRGISRSLSSICLSSLRNSSSRFSTPSVVASFSDGQASSSSTSPLYSQIFLCSSSFSSFRASRDFVLLNVSSRGFLFLFLSARSALSLSTFAVSPLFFCLGIF